MKHTRLRSRLRYLYRRKPTPGLRILRNCAVLALSCLAFWAERPLAFPNESVRTSRCVTDRDEKKRLRDTTKPEHRPSWGVSRDNAPKGAAAINWGDRGVPAPSPGGIGGPKKTGLFKNGLQGLAPRPQPEKAPPSPKEISGLFSEKARETRGDQAAKALTGESKTRAPSPDPSPSTSARIEPKKLDQKPVFRRIGRDDDRGRGR